MNCEIILHLYLNRNADYICTSYLHSYKNIINVKIITYPYAKYRELFRNGFPYKDVNFVAINDILELIKSSRICM